MSTGAILNQIFPEPMLPQILVTPIVPFSSVTASNGLITYNGIYNGSVWVIDVDDFGDYNITAVKADGSGTSEDVVSVTVNRQYEIELGAPTILPVLNDNSWETISYVSTHNLGQSYWSVGDTKQITLSGIVGTVNFNNYTTWVYIIGFNHNEALEGQGITFGTFKTASNSGTDVALVDSSYNSFGSSAAFRMNTRNTNYGGWKDSYMRNNICGTSESTTSGRIMGAIPAALRDVLKSVTKYTNNNGISSSSGAVTATTDYFFLLAEYEVFGNITFSNTYEANYQQQYAYYSAGNSKVKYEHNSTGSAVIWWLRSPCAGDSSYFVRVDGDGTVNYYHAYYSHGFAPGFCV